jgi:tight adherence protein B
MEAKASAAIIASLPVVVGAMLSVSTPRYIELLWITEAGKLSLAISAFWMFIGVMVMRKMINFDF